MHGSRGLVGGFRHDSDVDLSLLVALTVKTNETTPDLGLLDEVAHTTLDTWQSSIEVDLAVIFDQRCCGLHCFDNDEWNDQICQGGGVGCFGLYKVQKGFNGLVNGSGIEVKRIYPCLKIWQHGL